MYSHSNPSSMPNYFLSWNRLLPDYQLEIAVKPDDGVAVAGHLRIRGGVGQPDVVKELGYHDLVPSWTHTFVPNESVLMTLMFAFHTAQASNVVVTGNCLTATGQAHQRSYNETYSGQREETVHAYVWADQ